MPNKITLGFLGETRIDKGFSRLPNFINILSSKNINCDFIIQFSKKIYPNTVQIKKQILDISEKNNNESFVSTKEKKIKKFLLSYRKTHKE